MTNAFGNTRNPRNASGVNRITSDLGGLWLGNLHNCSADELAAASECYAALAKVGMRTHSAHERERIMKIVPPMWPFESSYWRPKVDPRGNLAMAGAFAALAIDKLNDLENVK